MKCNDSRHWRRLSILVICALSCWLCANAQPYTIDWHKVSGGSGTSGGGLYSVSGTVGQADASSAMTGGNYSLTGGFVAVVQMPGAPTLVITRTGPNTLVVSWPSPSTGFVLQQNGLLKNTAGWTSYGGSINDNGTTKSVTITLPQNNLFFRLKQ